MSGQVRSADIGCVSRAGLLERMPVFSSKSEEIASTQPQGNSLQVC